MAYAIESKRDSTTRADCFAGAKQKKKRRLSPVGITVFCVETVEIATEDEMKRAGGLPAEIAKKKTAGNLLAEIAKIESAVRL